MPNLRRSTGQSVQSVLTLMSLIIAIMPISESIKCRMFERRSSGAVVVDKLDECDNSYCCFGVVIKGEKCCQRYGRMIFIHALINAHYQWIQMLGFIFFKYFTLLPDLSKEYEIRGCEDVYRRFLDFMPEMFFYPRPQIGHICEREKCIHVKSVLGMATNICACKKDMCNKYPVMAMWELWRNRSWEKESIVVGSYPHLG